MSETSLPETLLPPAAAQWAPRTREHWGRYYARFAAFQTTCPDRPLTEQISAWLATLTPAMAHCARKALKAKFPGVPWAEIPRRRYWRDEAKLRTSLLDASETRARLAAALESPRERVLVELCYTLRRAEIPPLRWRDCDLDRGLVSVVLGKGGKASWTLLTPGAVAALQALAAAEGEPHPSALVLPARRWEVPGIPVPLERPFHPTSLNHQLRRILRRVGLYRKWRGAHAFRRTMATLYLRQNPGDLNGLKTLLRHEHLNTTVLYVYANPEDLAPRLAQAFGGPHGS